jgi:hypothetical protein
MNHKPPARVRNGLESLGKMSGQDAVPVSASNDKLRQDVVHGTSSRTLNIDHDRVGGIEGGQQGGCEGPQPHRRWLA